MKSLVRFDWRALLLVLITSVTWRYRQNHVLNRTEAPMSGLVKADVRFAFDFHWECKFSVEKISTPKLEVVFLEERDVSLFTKHIREQAANASKQYHSLLLEENDFIFPVFLFQKISKFLSQERYLSLWNTFDVFLDRLLLEAKMCRMNTSSESLRQFPFYEIFLSGVHNAVFNKEIDQTHPHYRLLRHNSVPISSVLYPQFNVAVVLTSSHRDCWELREDGDCPLLFSHPSFPHLVEQLQREFNQLRLIASITLVYGFPFLESPATIAAFHRNHDKLVPLLGHLCYLHAQPVGIHVGNHPVRDLRLFYARIGAEKYHSKFVVFIDPEMSDPLSLKPSWLLSLVLPSLSISAVSVCQSNLFKGALQERLTLAVNLEGPSFELNDREYFLPTSLVLSSSFFQLIRDFELNGFLQYLPEDILSLESYSLEKFWSFELPSCSEDINDALITDFFETMGSAVFITSTDITRHRPLIVDPLELEDFFDQVYLNRRLLFSRLSRKYHWTEQDYIESLLRVSTDHLLRDLYCQHAAGCLLDTSDKVDERGGRGATSGVTEELRLADFGLQALPMIIRGAAIDNSPSRSITSTSFIRSFPQVKSDLSTVSISVAVITAIYGNYEANCKPFAQQTIPTDFYCFTENPYAGISRDWIVDSFPYHLLHLIREFDLNHFDYRNAYHHNQHPFNVAKYYKLSFHMLPMFCEHQYDYILWVDGTVLITNHYLVASIRQLMNPLFEYNDGHLSQRFLYHRRIVAFEHTIASSIVHEADEAMKLRRYHLTNYNGFYQPPQPIPQQLEAYMAAGYQVDYWKHILHQVYMNTSDLPRHRHFYGLWVTCFLAFDMRSRREGDTTFWNISDFLEMWFQENQQWTTEDQISFVYTLFKATVFPYSLPNSGQRSELLKQDPIIYGNFEFNSFFIKLEHGK